MILKLSGSCCIQFMFLNMRDPRGDDARKLPRTLVQINMRVEGGVPFTTTILYIRPFAGFHVVGIFVP